MAWPQPNKKMSHAEITETAEMIKKSVLSEPSVFSSEAREPDMVRGRSGREMRNKYGRISHTEIAETTEMIKKSVLSELSVYSSEAGV